VGYTLPEEYTALIQTFLDRVPNIDKARLSTHCHNDLGLAVANSLTAFEVGADCVHGTILGIGERVGNTSLDQLLVNLKLLGWIDQDLSVLPKYCQLVHEFCAAPLPFNYPVMGRDAFRTSTGVHAAAIIKAKEKGEDFLANRVYSGVPAELVGRTQEIEIGPMSGQSNVIYWLKQRGIDPKPDLVETILEEAKRSDKILEEQEVHEIIRRQGG
jgi:2-isopropylmalate synthase